jgi:hypothetical protein
MPDPGLQPVMRAPARIRKKMMQLTRTLALMLVLSFGLLGLFGSCSQRKSKSEHQPSSGLTESQRDSAIAASKLPGAKAVGRAMAISDSAKARADRIDVQP